VVDDASTEAGMPLWQTKLPLGSLGKTLALIVVGRLKITNGDGLFLSYHSHDQLALTMMILKIAKAFNMNAIVWSPNTTIERTRDVCVALPSQKRDLLEKATLTRHIISAADFARMKPSAFFNNTPRGPLVDEEAPIQALQDKIISGAGLDVFLTLCESLRTSH
jgi:hypothetical protein